MYIEKMASMSDGKVGQGTDYQHSIVRFTAEGSIADIVDEIKENDLVSLIFADTEFFDDEERALRLCRDIRVSEMNILWIAQVANRLSTDLLQEMRLAGCQRLEMFLDPDKTVNALQAAREFGFEIHIHHADGTPYAQDRTSYTVTEREAIAERLPGLHSVQLDLATAYFKARRFREVMQPLGKAMTLGFPMNELCLNLLACLGAAKHYPDIAAGLLDQAQHGCPPPVVFRNRKLLKSWLESGGDLKGIRLMLEPDDSRVPSP